MENVNITLQYAWLDLSTNPRLLYDPIQDQSSLLHGNTRLKWNFQINDKFLPYFLLWIELCLLLPPPPIHMLNFEPPGPQNLTIVKDRNFPEAISLNEFILVGSSPTWVCLLPERQQTIRTYGRKAADCSLQLQEGTNPADTLISESSLQTAR